MTRWGIVFTPDNKPWFMEQFGPDGIVAGAQPSNGLKEWVEMKYGPFAFNPTVAFQSARLEWIDWAGK